MEQITENINNRFFSSTSDDKRANYVVSVQEMKKYRYISNFSENKYAKKQKEISIVKDKRVFYE